MQLHRMQKELCYERNDRKSAFDWEDHEVARRNEKEKEILLVKYICQKKKCSEGSNCKCRKSFIRCGPLCSCLDCGNVVLEAQGQFNELRDDELSSSSDEDEDKSDEDEGQ